MGRCSSTASSRRRKILCIMKEGKASRGRRREGRRVLCLIRVQIVSLHQRGGDVSEGKGGRGSGGRNCFCKKERTENVLKQGREQGKGRYHGGTRCSYGPAKRVEKGNYQYVQRRSRQGRSIHKRRNKKKKGVSDWKAAKSCYHRLEQGGKTADR